MNKGMLLSTRFTIDGEQVKMSFYMKPCEGFAEFTPEGVCRVRILIDLNNCQRMKVLSEDEFVTIAKNVDLRGIITSIHHAALDQLNGKYAATEEQL